MLDHDHIDLAQMERSAGKAAELLRALANERRLLVLCQLAGGERSVGQLQDRIGLSQSALSQHLAVLREQGIVATRRESQTIHYRIIDPATLQVMQALAAIFCPPRRNNDHEPQPRKARPGNRAGADRLGRGRPRRHPRSR